LGHFHDYAGGVFPLVKPMPLVAVREPFSDPEWFYEVKWDGFRALAFIDGHHCKLVSRRGHAYRAWPYLNEEIAHWARCDAAVLDGEIVCLAPDGRSQFYDLLFRRERPYFFAFDLLSLNGKDLRGVPLRTRKQRLARIMPRARIQSRLRLVEHIEGAGVQFFKAACKHDLEGIVAKWAAGTYRPDGRTSWLKIKNPGYSQAEGRHELFEKRRPRGDHARWTKPILELR